MGWGVRTSQLATVGLTVYYALSIILLLIADDTVNALPSASFNAGHVQLPFAPSGNWNQDLSRLTPSPSRKWGGKDDVRLEQDIGIESPHEKSTSSRAGPVDPVHANVPDAVEPRAGLASILDATMQDNNRQELWRSSGTFQKGLRIHKRENDDSPKEGRRIAAYDPSWGNSYGHGYRPPRQSADNTNDNGKGQGKTDPAEKGQVGQPEAATTKKKTKKKQPTEAEKTTAKADKLEQKRIADEAYQDWLQTPEGQKHLADKKATTNQKSRARYAVTRDKYYAGTLPEHRMTTIKNRLKRLGDRAKGKASAEEIFLASDAATDEDRQKYKDKMRQKQNKQNTRRRNSNAKKKQQRLDPNTPPEVVATLEADRKNVNAKAQEWRAREKVRPKTEKEVQEKAQKTAEKNAKRRAAYAKQNPKQADLTEAQLAELAKTDRKAASQIRASQKRRKKYREKNPKHPEGEGSGTTEAPEGSTTTETVAQNDGGGTNLLKMSTTDVRNMLAHVAVNPQTQSMVHNLQTGVQGMSFQKAIKNFHPSMLPKVRVRPGTVII
ncbi:MAG: hypothetical protein M1823_005479 [Watsoniomyces obsoletus]|nr:MAG: hypothetical protein M1823_005479 [Watsoniomyces obsoletus]